MKFLYIVRHAKTISGAGNLKDFDRYLKPRGHKDAELMANYIKKNHTVPGQLITSPAKRAKQTSHIFADVFNYDKNNIIEEPSIYSGGIEDLLTIFKNLNYKNHTAMLIGHNPTVHEMVNYFISSPVYHFPTCCVAGIQFDINDWLELGSHNGQLRLYEKPSNLK